ncbi:phosphopantetheine adenylyltransferase [Aliikangiella coralliicola]|uniref:Phosphopantetheine adenylyltransferase n=1 Tax=Aliikangiella coralliicola TaxID=2592383 RepID=A0A545U7I5_9GAMM|nr:phosphopantetheine adenylyltransferase [Aliikangiella coralliicola]TQV85428.1 phosphopantetheine adenylyltransferase [Aliikangiella coralliicola]
MQKVISILLLLVGVIHLLPLSGVFGAEQLASLYGLSFDDSSLVILMRHRAVLFGLLGVFFVIAAFKPALQFSAFVCGFVSVVSFIAIAWFEGGYNEAINRVILVDLVALLSLSIGMILLTLVKRAR